jgi:glycosyltransferase involved in cell wall biosynthesis
MAARHDLWVLTRARHRPEIEAHLAKNPVPGATFVYHDLPRWTFRWWKRGDPGTQLYYRLWQRSVLKVGRDLHSRIGFDLVHHVTFGRYWSPSYLVLLPPPFLWGPVGGGESCPPIFWPDMGRRGQFYEIARTTAQRAAELDPAVRRTARRAALTLVKTADTEARVRRLGAREVARCPDAALDDEDLDRLARVSDPPLRPLRFISVGRLIGWKGFHLGIEAFQRASLPGAEYWIVGDGPQREMLEALVAARGLGERVRFLGRLPRDETLARLAQCHVLVHPSLHDSSGWVALEAMAAGRPVLCLDLGGPAVQVTEATGIKVPATRPTETVTRLAAAMIALSDDGLRRSKGKAARRHVRENFSRSLLIPRLAAYYQRCVADAATGGAESNHMVSGAVSTSVQ